MIKLTEEEMKGIFPRSTAYKVRDKNGTWARQGFRFGNPIGKTWASKGHLKLAISSRFRYWLGREHYKDTGQYQMPDEEYVKRLKVHADASGWQFLQFGPDGAYWLTFEEFYGK